MQHTISFLKSEGIKDKNETIFQVNSVLHTIGYKMLGSNNLYTLRNNSIYEKTSRGLIKLIPKQIYEMEKIFQNTRLEGYNFTWMLLRSEI